MISSHTNRSDFSPFTIAWCCLLGGVPGLALGLAGGIVALVAIFRRDERALAVYGALVPFLNVVGFVLGSLLTGG